MFVSYFFGGLIPRVKKDIGGCEKKPRAHPATVSIFADTKTFAPSRCGNPRFFQAFLEQLPASILSRAARTSLNNDPEATEKKDVVARDRQIEVGSAAP